MARRLILGFICGAFLGWGYDYIHVYFGVLSYAHPHFAGTSVWVAFEFGGAACAGILGAQALARRVAAPAVTAKRFGFDALLLLVAYLLTGLFAYHNQLTFALLLGVAFVSVLTRPVRFIWIASAFAAIAGPISETFVSATGFFHYNVASPVPFWLPLLWVIAAGLFIDFAIAQPRALV